MWFIPLMQALIASCWASTTPTKLELVCTNGRKVHRKWTFTMSYVSVITEFCAHDFTISGSVLQYLAHIYNIWYIFTISGLVWLYNSVLKYLIEFYNIWSSFTISGSVSQYLAQFYNSWSSFTIYGSVWQYLSQLYANLIWYLLTLTDYHKAMVKYKAVQ